MLLANLSAAKHIFNHFTSGGAILRKHPPPFSRRLCAFLEFMSRNGHSIDASSSGALQTSLNLIKDPDFSLVSTVVYIFKQFQF